MEDLAWQYPAEPVERAALRFCEAMARWRGKPELETVRLHQLLPGWWLIHLLSYQYKHKRTGSNSSASSTRTLPMEDLVHSSPISPATNRTANLQQAPTLPRPSVCKPSIDIYFSPSSSPGPGTGGGSVSINAGRYDSLPGAWPRSPLSGKRYREDDPTHGRSEMAKRLHLGS